MITLAAGLAEIVNGVWSSLITLPITRYEGAPVETEYPAEHMMTCTVPIEGAWTGAVVVTCSSMLAERIAESMLHISGLAHADVTDALGEVTNMIAGNAKSLLPQPSKISLPVVTQGRDPSVGVPSMPVVARLAFQCEGLALAVTALGSARDQELA